MKSAQFVLAIALMLTTSIGLPLPFPGLSSARPALAQGSDPLKADDQIRITVVGFSDLSGEQTIGADGTIQLPLAGSVAIAGLSPIQASDRVTQVLAPYVRRPQVSLVVTRRSPLHINIIGEVVQPGPQFLAFVNTDTRDSNSVFPPTLSRALLLAGGIKPTANLRNVTIRRVVASQTMTPRVLPKPALPQFPQLTPAPSTVPLPETALSLEPQPLVDDRYTEITIDLWQVIQQGDLAADPRIYDGDQIIVPAAPITLADQQLMLASTIAPKSVVVQVAGEVRNPGQVTMKPTAGVSEAVAAAGGLTINARKKSVALLRLDANGRLQKQVFEFGKDSPILMNGDLIVVERSNRGKLESTFDLLGTIVNPFSPLIRLFERSGDN